mgnify:FL=1
MRKLSIFIVILIYFSLSGCPKIQKESPLNSSNSHNFSHSSTVESSENSKEASVKSEGEERLKIKDSDKEDTTSQSKENANLKESIQSSNEEKEVTSEEISQKNRKLLTISLKLQEQWYFCAPATVQMILSSQGISVTQELLAKEMGTYEPYGTHNRDAIRVLNQHLFGYPDPTANQAGYRLATITSASPNSEDVQQFKNRVRKDIDEGYPLYYTINMSKIYAGRRGEHNVIGIGYELTADGKDIAAIYYLDPNVHVQDPTYGGLKKVTPEELLEAMVACDEKNYAW